ncbi:MAG: hypothetical protein JO115_04450 [Pseudonocardiales bacterium]|nr:hypothetical protein [Pseudonocardiales bacterium]
MTGSSPPAPCPPSRPPVSDQATTGVVILIHVRGRFGGTRVRLTVDEHATATGRFVSPGGIHDYAPRRRTR